MEDDLGAPGSSGGRQGSCEWHFSLAPTAEDDLANDYVATWIQIDADPPRGWCVTEINLTFAFDGAEVVSATRKGTAKYKSPRGVEELLLVDAGGAASSPGSIFSTTRVQPRRVDVQVNGDSLSYSWRGRASKPASVVFGYQLRVPSTQAIYSILSTRDVVISHCGG